MAKGKTVKGNKNREGSRGSERADAVKGKAQSRAAAATLPEGDRKHKSTPASTDIRRRYMKSLLGDYLGSHRGAAAIKPKK
jgi:hypothetical protein